MSFGGFPSVNVNVKASVPPMNAVESAETLFSLEPNMPLCSASVLGPTLQEANKKKTVPEEKSSYSQSRY